MPMRLALFLSMAFIAVSGFAQQVPSPAVIDAREQVTTDALNRAIQQNAQATDAANAERQRQYEQDRAAFRAAAEARRAKIMSDAMAYERQQRAYADAMAAWRIQSDACKKGDMKACKAPTPVPDDYYRY